MVLQEIGFWRNKNSPMLPHPAYLVDETWEIAERPKMVQYLKSGTMFCGYLGYSWCRFRDGPKGSLMGCSELTDGVWVWPEGLVVYVEQYSVRLPDEFVAHMRQNEYRIPDNINTEELRGAVTSEHYWCSWAKKQIKMLPWRRRLVRCLAAKLGSARLARF